MRRLVAALLLGPAIGWAALALWLDGPASEPAEGLAVGAFLAICAALAFGMRGFARRCAALAIAVAGVAAWWLSIPASNDRDWQPDVARLPRAAIAGSRITLENVRNFAYRTETDYDERWETRRYDLDALRGVDLFISYWGSPHIAHTIASWEFEGAPPLAISIETRKEKGESYSALRGFFRQYELYYVVADERDVIRLRTDFRGEDVYLYRIRMPLERARAVLLDYLEDVNRLAEHPRWYNAITNNCTTTIRYHTMRVAGNNPWSWKILANGHLDELIYQRGTVDTSLPFAELRRRSAISEKARSLGNAVDFSARIREGLPGFGS
jgi:Domain of unknown function (DUF4105)